MRKAIIFVILLGFNFLFVYGVNYANEIMFQNNFMIYLHEEDKPLIEDKGEEEEVINTEFNGESIEVVGKKLEKILKKTDLEGMGEYISKTSIRKGVNPYLIGGMILESTNCKRECSILFKQCHNVSEMKGDPGCFGGTYKKYNSVEDGITDLVNQISRDYEKVDMQTPNKMFKSYGKTEIWAFKVNRFMEQIKTAK